MRAAHGIRDNRSHMVTPILPIALVLFQMINRDGSGPALAITLDSVEARSRFRIVPRRDDFGFERNGSHLIRRGKISERAARVVNALVQYGFRVFACGFRIS